MADTVSLFDLHVQFPVDLEHFSMDTGGAAQKWEIDRRRTDAKLRQPQTIEPTWEQRTDDPKTLAEPIRLKLTGISYSSLLKPQNTSGN